MVKKLTNDNLKLEAFPEEITEDGIRIYGETSYENQMAVLSHYLHNNQAHSSILIFPTMPTDNSSFLLLPGALSAEDWRPHGRPDEAGRPFGQAEHSLGQRDGHHLDGGLHQACQRGKGESQGTAGGLRGLSAQPHHARQHRARPHPPDRLSAKEALGEIQGRLPHQRRHQGTDVSCPPQLARGARDGILGRTPAALNFKIGNLGSFDPVLRAKGIVGLGHTSKMDETVWNEFFDNPEKLAYESERIIAERMHLSRRTVENHLYLSRIEMREFMRKAM